jgi:hypothetical protein
MFLNVKQLLALGLVTVTKDGKLVVSCSTIHAKVTYKGREIRVIDGHITITLPPALKRLAPEQLCEHTLDLVVEIDPKRSHDERVKVMAGLESAPARATVPPPVINADSLTATICVASKNANFLPEDASVTIVMGESTRALVTVNVNNISKDKNRNLYMSSGLRFTFHRDIAEEAMALLQKAWEEEQDQEETESSVSPASPIPSCIIPIPMFGSDGSTSSGNWADDADDMVFAIPAPAPTPTPAFLPSEDEVSALSGAFDNVLTRQEQKAQRLKEAQCQEAVDPVTQNAEIMAHSQHSIFVKNMDRNPLDAMVALAKKRGIDLSILQSGQVFFLDVSLLLAKRVLTMNVAPWGNEIRCGILTTDGTFRHGCIANVDQGSYMAVVNMFPEMGKIVQEVMQVRDELKVRNLPPSHQGLLPMPKLVWYIVPIIGADGSIMAYQQVPRYA